jgi:hypothetical protein
MSMLEERWFKVKFVTAFRTNGEYCRSFSQPIKAFHKDDAITKASCWLFGHEIVAVTSVKEIQPFVVKASQGQGGVYVADFPNLKAALLYVKQNEGSASYGIIKPNGKWHHWKKKK